MKKTLLILGNITLYQEPPTKAVVHEIQGILLCESPEQAELLGEMLSIKFEAYVIPSVYAYPIEYKCPSIEGIADQLATVRDWCDIPEETYSGINGVIDSLNDLFKN